MPPMLLMEGIAALVKGTLTAQADSIAVKKFRGYLRLPPLRSEYICLGGMKSPFLE